VKEFRFDNKMENLRAIGSDDENQEAEMRACHEDDAGFAQELCSKYGVSDLFDIDRYINDKRFSKGFFFHKINNKAETTNRLAIFCQVLPVYLFRFSQLFLQE